MNPTDAAIPTPRTDAEVMPLSSKLVGMEVCYADFARQLERELHLAKSPMVASEAAKAAARELLNNDKAAHEAAGMEWHHDEGDVNDVAAIITRHFQPGLEENERLKAGGADPELQADFKALYDDFVARGVECGNLRLRLATLNKELEEAREALEIANRSADDQMHQKRDAHAALAQCQRERDGAQNTVKRIWNALGLTTYEEAQPFPVWEHVLRIATDRDTLRAQLAQAEATLIEAMGRDTAEGCSLHEMCALIVSQRDNARTCEDTYKGKVEAMREAIPATVYRAFPTVDDRECHMAKLIHDLRSALTPGAGERTT